MNKSMIKIILKCILTVCLIFIPYILVNYFLIIYYNDDSDISITYIIIAIKILHIISTIAVGLIFRRKYKSIIKENSALSKRYMIGALIAFLIVTVLCFTELYWGMQFILTSYMGGYDTSSIFWTVCCEQIANGRVLWVSTLCVFICFTGNISLKNRKTA